MSKIVRDKIKEANKSNGSKEVPLKEALQAVLSRPNTDDLVEKVISPLKSALDEEDSWETAVKQLVREATGALKNPKAFKPVIQVTYLVFLENLMAELKPKANAPFEKSVFEEIKGAKIELTKAARDERVLRMMKETRSPSQIAEETLLSIEQFEQEKKNKLEASPVESSDEVKQKKKD